MLEIITGPPGHGKSAFATSRILDALHSPAYKNVFSTFPVYDKKTGRWSKQWQREYIYDGIQDSLIVHDEAHNTYPSRGSGNRYAKDVYHLGVTQDEHNAWMTCRHDGNDFIFITQSFNRIDTILREVWETWWKCRAFEIPIVRNFSDQLLYMSVKGFDEETAKDPYRQETHWLPGILSYRKVFAAYNTHQHKKPYVPKDYPMWSPDSNIKDYLKTLARDENLPEEKDD